MRSPNTVDCKGALPFALQLLEDQQVEDLDAGLSEGGKAHHIGDAIVVHNAAYFIGEVGDFVYASHAHQVSQNEQLPNRLHRTVQVSAVV